MVRLGDLDRLKQKFLEWLPKDNEDFVISGINPVENIAISAIMEIEEAPTIDAEHVVYCKHCIRWQKDKTYNIGYCDIIDGHTNPKNFCCWGEESPFRKKDGDQI